MVAAISQKISPADLPGMSNRELVFTHAQLHKFWQNHFADNTLESSDGMSREDAVNSEIFLEEEMQARGISHAQQDELDRIAAAFAGRVKDLGQKFNPHHGAGGRFASGSINVQDGIKGIDRKELESWEGIRKTQALGTYDDIKKGTFKGFVLKDGNEAVAICSLGGTIKIGAHNCLMAESLASKRPGYGKKAMQEVARRASTQGLGVYLIPAKPAAGFYKKIGAKSMGRSGAGFSPEEAKRFASSS